MPRKTVDPTRTALLRRQLSTQMRKKLAELRSDIYALIVEQDALGLRPAVEQLRLNAEEWRFQTNEQKLQSFKRWFNKQVEQRLLTTDHRGDPWVAKYVDTAYRKGMTRAFMDSRKKKELRRSLDFFEGTKEEFLRSAFRNPERLSKAKLLASRVFEELEGVSSAMATRMNRVLATGLLQGVGPRQIAERLAEEVSGLGERRALTIARTEIVHAHAEGQLDAFEEMGADGVSVMAEWSTAGDDRVCSQCSALEGQVLKIEEARGLIPRHPNCRCAFVPTEEEASKTRKKRLKAAIARSVRAERPKAKNEKQARKQSAWAGKGI